MMNPPHNAAVQSSGTPATAARGGLPAGASVERLTLPAGEPLELVSLAAADAAPGSGAAQDSPAHLAAVAAAWITATPSAGGTETAPVHVPLYGSHVVWSPARAAVIGPSARLTQLRTALVEFAIREAELRDAERRAARLLDGSEADAEVACMIDERLVSHRATAAARYREAVAVRRCLAGLTAAIHAPPVHPPTLASQLGERLRDRTRLAERHEQAVEKVEIAERVADGCSQRAADLVIARRQLGLEWAIVTLLVAQTALLLIDLLATRGAP